MDEAKVRDLIDTEVLRTEWEPKQVMPKVNGIGFRCDCGSNVFTEYKMLRYRCNGCEATYTGEK